MSSQPLQPYLKRLTGFLRSERVMVLALKQGQLEVQASRGLNSDFAQAALSDAIFQRVLQTGQALLSGDVTGEDFFPESNSLLLSEIRSVLCVPYKDRAGKVAGLFYADSRARHVAFSYTDLLRAQQVARSLEDELWPRTPTPTAPRAPVSAAPRRTPERKGAPVRERDLAMLLQGLATMVSAGISLVRVLHFLARPQGQPGQEAVARDWLEGVERGNSLALTVASTPGTSSFVVNTLKLAERTGRLADCLARLARYEETRLANRHKLKARLTYPLLLLGFCLMLLVLVVPWLVRTQMSNLSHQVELPWLSQVVFACSRFLGSPPALLLVLVLGLGLVKVFYRHWNKPGFRLELYRQAYRIKPLRRFLSRWSEARFAASLATALGAGLDLLGAVQLALESCDDPIWQSHQSEIIKALQNGASLTDALRQTRLVGSILLGMTLAGEESGTLPRTLQWGAQLLQSNLDLELESLTSLLEPFLLLLMGNVVALVALATLLPLLKTVQSL